MPRLRSRLDALARTAAPSGPAVYLVQHQAPDGTRTPTDAEHARRTAEAEAGGAAVVTWIVVHRVNAPTRP